MEAHAVGDTEPIGSGWVAFAGAYLMIAGLLNMVWGVTALTKSGYFVEGGLIWSSLDFWGWVAVVVAVAQFAAGMLVYARRAAGVVAGILLAVGGLLVNFLTLGAYPLWSAIGIACCLLVMWALTVHNEDFSRAR